MTHEGPTEMIKVALATKAGAQINQARTMGEDLYSGGDKQLSRK